MKYQLSFLFVLFSIGFAFGQTSQDSNYIFWSSSHKFTVDDFFIKTKNLETSPSFAQFSMDYQVGGFDFLAKNLNKKIRNYMIKSASSIDTTYDVEASLRYQQTLFDISEIYTRQFRKELKENRRKIATGLQFVEELNSQALTNFANRRVEYDRETKYGTVTERQMQWEKQIQKELNELKEFSNE